LPPANARQYNPAVVRCPWTILVLLLARIAAATTDAPLPDTVEFNAHVRPILSDRCFPCHGPDANQREAELRLDVRDSALAERKGVRAIVPGDVDASELVRRITSDDPDDRMPPPSSRRTLEPRDVALLTRWVEQGAEYQPHWAYRPLARPALPEVRNAAWVRNPIDRFVLAELETRAIAPAPPAPRHVLLRRLGLDVVGLPPLVKEVAAFESSDGETAYDAAIESLLASPHYGERMAASWLDLVRFADTNGYNEDQHRNIHPYRDWVIAAFNDDMPFDRFTIEQLAGDLLPSPAVSQLVATGYNRLNKVSSETGSQEKEFAIKYAADRARTTAAVWMGATLGCAECHDHKFDPYTARDFYRFTAFFADIQEDPVPPLLTIPLPPEVGVRSAAGKATSDRLAALDRSLERARQARTDAAARAGESLAAARAAWARGGTPAAEVRVAPPPWPSTTTGATPDASGGLQLRRTDLGMVEVSRSFRTAPGDVEFDLDVTSLTFPANAEEQFELAWVLRHEPASSGLSIRLSRSFGGAPTLRTSLAGKDGAIVGLQFAGGLHALRLHARWDFTTHEWTAAYAVDGEATLTPFPDGPIADRADIEIGDGWGEVISLAGVGSASDVGPLAPELVVAPTLVRQHDGLRHPPDDVAAARAVPPEKRTKAQHRLVDEHFLAHAPGLDEWNLAIEKLVVEQRVAENGVPRTLITAAGPPRPTRVLARGDWMDETGEIVEPGVPAFLPPMGAHEPQNRLGLARWLVAADNPLTARVLVNRLWKQFFGHGLARTLDDVGSQGAWPSHPTLLDWLAVELVESGWSVKHVVRLIVGSNTYRQSSNLRPDLIDVDPDNQLFARQSAFRLDAESIRDNALAVSGLLSRAVGGPSMKPYQPEGYWDGVSKFLPMSPASTWRESRAPEQYRRGLYVYWKRTFPHPSMLAFDAPTREDCVAERTRSNTPLQALVLLNDPTYVEAARALATLAARQPGGLNAQIRWAHRRAVAHDPDAPTLAALRELHDRHLREYRHDPAAAVALTKIGQAPPGRDVDPVQLAAMTSVCRVLLNLHETVTRS